MANFVNVPPQAISDPLYDLGFVKSIEKGQLEITEEEAMVAIVQSS